MNILQLNSSARRVQDGQGSFSTRLANELVDGLKAANSQARLTVRDLGLTPHPAMDEAALGALFTPADQRTPEQVKRVAENDALIAELFANDVIVIATPMINFGVPSQLKHWIDAVARAGTTFKYGATGPVGQVTGKKVYVITASGGIHRNQASDGITSYLRTLLGFLGMTDVQFIYAEGLAMGPDAEAAGVAAARAQIAEVLGTVAA